MMLATLKRRRRWFRRNHDSLDLLGMELIDLCSHLIAIGGTGSGKTSVLKILIADAIRRGGDQLGSLFAAVKPDELSNVEEILKSAGATGKMIRLTPGQFTYNFLAYELGRVAGSPRTATDLLLDLNKLLSRSSGDGDDSFWANLFAKMCEYSITICWIAKGDQVTVEDVYRLIVTSPTTFEQVASETFQDKSFCYKMLKEAENRIATESDRRLYTQAATFFFSEAIQLGSKARGAAISQVSAVLSPFLQSPMFETVCCETSSFSPEMAITGSHVVMDLPVMTYGQAGMLFQSLLTRQVTEAALRRQDPTHMTLIVRDELPVIIGEAYQEALTMSVARSQLVGFISGCTSLPTLQAAMGGNNAEQELHSIVSNYSTRLILSTSCSRTASYFSDAWGNYRSDFISVSETKPHEQFDMMNTIFGVDDYQVSVSQQLVPRCPVENFLALRRGGRGNRLMVDAFLCQAGKTYGPNRSPYTLVSFKQR